jgi:hypothetical protein
MAQRRKDTCQISPFREALTNRISELTARFSELETKNRSLEETCLLQQKSSRNLRANRNSIIEDEYESDDSDSPEDIGSHEHQDHGEQANKSNIMKKMNFFLPNSGACNPGLR